MGIRQRTQSRSRTEASTGRFRQPSSYHLETADCVDDRRRGIAAQVESLFARADPLCALADRCAHLNLQINLLTERATTKCIGMLLEIGKRFDIQRGVRRGEP